MATAGRNGVVHIWDRHGLRVPDGDIVLKGSGEVLALEWDASGEVVAVLQQGNGVVELWDLKTRSVMPLDTNLKDPTFLKWATSGPELAIGTGKGNLLLYNADTRRKVPVLGKHAKKISCGAWSASGRLAMASEDRTLTISDKEGNTHDQRELKSPAIEMCFAGGVSGSLGSSSGGGGGGGGGGVGESKSDGESKSGGGGRARAGAVAGAESHLSVNMGTSLLLYDLRDPDNPLELAFQQKYGRIVTHCWFDDAHIMLGFSEGFLVVISTRISEIGEELYSARFHHSSLTDVAYSPALKLAACAGDGGVKVVDCSRGFDDVPPPEDVPLLAGVGGEPARKALSPELCSKVGWSPDGQILTVATVAGSVHGFLARMQIVNGAFKASVAYLSSLKEVSVLDVRTTMGGPLKVPVALEPEFLALGGMHLAVGSHSRVAFHRCLPDDTALVGPGPGGRGSGEQEYGADVMAVALNDKYAAVLTANGKATLHEIEPGAALSSPGPGQSNPAGLPQRRKVFPEMGPGSGSPQRDAKGGRHGGGGGSGGEAIAAIALTDHAFLYGTQGGAVEVFLLEAWTSLPGATLHHSEGIAALHPSPSGTRVVVLDARGGAFMGNPVTSDLTPFPLFPGSPRGGKVRVMWDTAPDCASVVQAWDGRDVHAYVYAPSTVKGPLVSKLGPIEVGPSGEITVTPAAHALPPGCTPILSHRGEVTCQDGSGAPTVVNAPHFVPPAAPGSLRPSGDAKTDKARARQAFTQALALLNLSAAWDAALAADSKPLWYALSYKAMELMDINLAVRVYRELGDAGMVMGLERLVGVEDKKLLAGHIALLYDDYQRAQDLFLASARPLAALEMRRDLLHWDQALKLALTLAPEQAPAVEVELARQLEFRGDHAAALKTFESALSSLQAASDQRDRAKQQGLGGALQSPRRGSIGGSPPSSPPAASSAAALADGAGGGAGGASVVDLEGVALAGIARCTLRLGDLRRGLRFVAEAKDPALCRDCAKILEGMSHTVAATEAASLYEQGGQFDKAVAIYIRHAKTLPLAKALVDHVTSPKLLAAYALKCEQEGQFQEASVAYSRARDTDAVVRLCLGELRAPNKAFELVRSSASSTGAQLVAHYCKGEGNYRGAIEFLLMAKCGDEAFELAKAHESMDVYTDALGDGIGSAEADQVAKHYEALNDLGRAGRFFSLCGQYGRALKLFLQCGEAEVDRAIEVVGRARQDALTHTLIDFLMGETDGVPKEPVHIYRLYLALGNFGQAAKTAIIIARQEQDLGNYKEAHAVLCETIARLEEQKVHVPQSLRRPFTLLHSYTLVRKLVKRGDHDGAARMLLRVSESISKFPSHRVPILTSTVIECTKAGLKASALEYAMALMRPEYRSQLDPKFKKKIEALVRKQPRDGGDGDGGSSEAAPLTACPVSGLLIPATSLECPTTKDPLPMCVVTGRHVVADDCCLCPRSRMPALFSAYVAYITEETRAAAAAAVAEKGQEGKGGEPRDEKAGGGGGGGGVGSGGVGSVGGSAPDPVTGAPVFARELVRMTREEVAAFIAVHNQNDEEAKDKADPAAVAPETTEKSPGKSSAGLPVR